MRSAQKRLEDFNVELCRESGAGQGHATTAEASAAYHRLLHERRDEARLLIERARQDNPRSPFVDGMADALDRAISPCASALAAPSLQLTKDTDALTGAESEDQCLTTPSNATA